MRYFARPKKRVANNLQIPQARINQTDREQERARPPLPVILTPLVPVTQYKNKTKTKQQRHNHNYNKPLPMKFPTNSFTHLETRSRWRFEGNNFHVTSFSLFPFLPSFLPNPNPNPNPNPISFHFIDSAASPLFSSPSLPFLPLLFFLSHYFIY